MKAITKMEKITYFSCFKTAELMLEVKKYLKFNIMLFRAAKLIYIFFIITYREYTKKNLRNG